MLGRANAGREWLCGGIRRKHLEPRPRKEIRSIGHERNFLRVGATRDEWERVQVPVGGAITSGSAGL